MTVTAASQLLPLGQGNAKALQLDNCCSPADNTNQKLAKNRATAALSRYVYGWLWLGYQAVPVLAGCGAGSVTAVSARGRSS